MLQRKFGTAVFAAAALVTAVAGNLDAQILRGSQASVDRMYSFAVDNDFDFLTTATAVRTAVTGGKLVELPSQTADYELHNIQHPYVMPAAKLFIERLAQQYREFCKQRLVVTSAVRPTNMRVRNASDQSVHSTGMAVDIRSTKIPAKCRTWLRTTLEGLERSGVVEATEEKKVPHFHVAVYPGPYTGYVAAQRKANIVVAEASTGSTASTGPSDPADAQPVSYQVRTGDSLWRIATKHDTTVRALQDLNNLRTATIHPGQVILVPAQNHHQ